MSIKSGILPKRLFAPLSRIEFSSVATRSGLQRIDIAYIYSFCILTIYIDIYTDIYHDM